MTDPTPKTVQVKLESLREGDRFLVYELDSGSGVSFKRDGYPRHPIEAVVLNNNGFDTLTYGWFSDRPRTSSQLPCFAKGCNRYMVSHEPAMVDRVAPDF